MTPHPVRTRGAARGTRVRRQARQGGHAARLILAREAKRAAAKAATAKAYKYRPITKPSSELTRKIRVDGPMSESFYKWRAMGHKINLGVLKKVIAKQFYIQNDKYRLQCGVGQQAFPTSLTTTPRFFDYTDIAQIFTLANLNTAAGATVKNPLTQRVFLKSCQGELMISNQTNDVVHLQLFECIARRDIPTNNCPGLAWAQGNVDEGQTNMYQIVGSNPFQSPMFTELFLVEKIIDVNIHTGGHHVHKFKCNVKHMFSNEILQQMSSTTVIGKMTRFTFPVIHGYPGNDSVIATQVSTISCGIDMVWKKQYEFEIFEKSTTSASYTQNLTTAFNVSSNIVNDLTGAISSSLIA